MAAKIEINGKETGRNSPVIIVIRPEAATGAQDAAEALVRTLTGRQPFAWTDGAGTLTVGASQKIAEPEAAQS
jgi:hypothetical protein